jgi:putative FmdB family regulatory protein
MFDGHEHGTLEPHMPLYEYRCEEDGNVITLLRPMAQADEPVEDPEGRGRAFTRIHSTFAVNHADAPRSSTNGSCSANGGCCCHPH